MSRKVQEYSDLPETVSQYPDHEGMQTMPSKTEKTPQYASQPAPYREGPETLNPDTQPEMRDPPGPKRRICGIARWLFMTLVLIVAVIVIAAAVGGGVAGSMKHTSTSGQAAVSSSTAAPSANTISTASGTSATGTTASITTSALPGPTGSTIYRDCDSSNNTIYSYGDPTSPLLFRRFCNVCPQNSNGYAADNVVIQNTTSRDACIQLCASYDSINQAAIQAKTKTICNAVCWRYEVTNPQVGLCLGYQTGNLSGTFDFQAGGGSDSAVWINQSFD